MHKRATALSYMIIELCSMASAQDGQDLANDCQLHCFLSAIPTEAQSEKAVCMRPNNHLRNPTSNYSASSFSTEHTPSSSTVFLSLHPVCL